MKTLYAYVERYHDIQHNNFLHRDTMLMLSIIILTVAYAECLNYVSYVERPYSKCGYTEFHYTDYHYAECHYTECCGVILVNKGKLLKTRQPRTTILSDRNLRNATTYLE